MLSVNPQLSNRMHVRAQVLHPWPHGISRYSHYAHSSPVIPLTPGKRQDQSRDADSCAGLPISHDYQLGNISWSCRRVILFDQSKIEDFTEPSTDKGLYLWYPHYKSWGPYIGNHNWAPEYDEKSMYAVVAPGHTVWFQPGTAAMKEWKITALETTESNT